jgi:hypothetical protein
MNELPHIVSCATKKIDTNTVSIVMVLLQSEMSKSGFTQERNIWPQIEEGKHRKRWQATDEAFESGEV